MFPNPYVAQKMAEMKIADAHREAEKDRLLASLPRQRSRRNVNWTMAAAVVSAVTLILVSL
jgi:hypothetical protein